MGKVSEGRVEGGPVSSFDILRRGKTGTFRGLWRHLALQTRLTIASSGGQVYDLVRRELDNGNSRQRAVDACMVPSLTKSSCK